MRFWNLRLRVNYYYPPDDGLAAANGKKLLHEVIEMRLYSISARSSLLPKALPISCRCIADILPINYSFWRGVTDLPSPAIRLPPKP